MVTKSILEDLEVGKKYSGEQLRNFIAYNRVGSIIFCLDMRICNADPQARFVIEEVLEGFISKRRNDYKNHFGVKQKIYIVSRE